MRDDLERQRNMIPLTWLLDGEPFIRYRTLVDLVGMETIDDEAEAARMASSGSSSRFNRLFMMSSI